MRYLLTLTFTLCTLLLSAEQRPDILGENFTQQTLKMENDYSGEVTSTLVRTLPIVEGQSAILYIHGYNDYFFQSDMALRLRDSSYNFYAIDLRKYGRSMLPTQTPFEVHEMEEYFEDIDAAISIIREEGARKVILMGHSTGGLTTALYAHHHRVDGLILNSPFLDMNLGSFVETFAVPIVSLLGEYKPDIVITKGGEMSNYARSIHKAYDGEWEYDENLKFTYSKPITAGWIHAINKAQKVVKSGFPEMTTPVLLMYSDKSYTGSEWCDEYSCSDTVLDVADIAKYGDRLGTNVTHAEIHDGLHDLSLSKLEAREEFYHRVFNWLKEQGL